uniref:Uncharacterized protein n=1 Tax=Arundo donax TaxID=35708 RepID=A0A0A9CKH8_ARUDO
MDVMAKRGGKQPGLARSLVMLLVNLTQLKSGVAALLQVRLSSHFFFSMSQHFGRRSSGPCGCTALLAAPAMRFAVLLQQSRGSPLHGMWRMGTWTLQLSG